VRLLLELRRYVPGQCGKQSTRRNKRDAATGVEVRVTPMRTEVIIRATRTQNVLGAFLTCVLEAALRSA